MSDSEVDDLNEIRAEIRKLQGQVRERETSIARAVQMLWADWQAVRDGRISSIPPESWHGLINAFFWRRKVVFLAGGVGLCIGVMQVWIMLQQNRLVEQQSILLESQSRSNAVEAVSSVLAQLDEADLDSIERTIVQLSVLARSDIAAVETIARSRSVLLGHVGKMALAHSWDSLDARSRKALLDQVFNQLFRSFAQDKYESFKKIGGENYHTNRELVLDFLAQEKVGLNTLIVTNLILSSIEKDQRSYIFEIHNSSVFELNEIFYSAVHEFWEKNESLAEQFFYIDESGGREIALFVSAGSTLNSFEVDAYLPEYENRVLNNLSALHSTLKGLNFSCVDWADGNRPVTKSTEIGIIEEELLRHALPSRTPLFELRAVLDKDTLSANRDISRTLLKQHCNSAPVVTKVSTWTPIEDL